jgi:hypothetical protein
MTEPPGNYVTVDTHDLAEAEAADKRRRRTYRHQRWYDDEPAADSVALTCRKGWRWWQA